MDKLKKLSKYQEDEIFGFPEDEIGSMLSPKINPSFSHSPQTTNKPKSPILKSRASSHPLKRSPQQKTIRSKSQYHSLSPPTDLPKQVQVNHHNIDEIEEESDLEIEGDFTGKINRRYELSEDERTSEEEYFLKDISQNFKDKENFEDGFDDFETIKFDTLKLDDYKTIKPKPMKDVRKFKSSVNLNSRVISKLDRIPSFYNKKLSNMIEQEQNYQITKDQLLAQYKEIDKQHQRTKKLLSRSMSSNAIHDIKSSKDYQDKIKSRKKKEMKTIKTTEIPQTPNMKFNSNLRIWEGNNGDLKKFERPSTIKLSDYKLIKPSGMVFDSENMKWVNDPNSNQNDDDDILKIPDLQETQVKFDDVLEIGKSKVSRWLLEEDRLKRKISEWGNRGDYSTDYFWDIRKLVMES